MTALPFETRPLHPLFGVEILGVDLARDGERLHGAIREAFDRHSVILFRGQAFGAEDHLALARRFGPLEDRKADERKPGEGFEISQVSNRREDGTITDAMDLHTLHLKANQLWHTDSTFLPVPALANLLVARVVSSTGGETEFASTRAGWAAMPEALKERVRNALIWHRYSHSRARISPELAALPMFHKWPDRPWRAVWTNPATGEEALYIASHAFRVEGMAEDEGARLIDELIAFCTAPGRVYSHAWRPGDVLVFDERATLHRGMPWPYEEERTLSSICVSAGEADGLASIRP